MANLPLILSRTEAEYIIDLIEKDDIPQFAELAEELRKEWGMGPKMKYAHGVKPEILTVYINDYGHHSVPVGLMDKVPVKRNGEPDYRYKASNKVAAWCKVKDIETRAAYINSDGLKP